MDIKPRVRISEGQVNAVLSLLLVILVFLIGFHGIYRVRQEEIATIRRETTAFKAKLNLLHVVSAEEKQTTVLRDRLAGFEDLSQLLAFVNKLAGELSITVNSMNPGDLDTRGYVEIQPLHVEMECTYHDLGTFLARVESQGPHVRVEQLELVSLERDAAGRPSVGFSPASAAASRRPPALGSQSARADARAILTLAAIRPKK